MGHIFFLIPRVNEDIINKDDNEQVQVLLERSIHQKFMKALGALVSPNDVNTNS